MAEKKISDMNAPIMKLRFFMRSTGRSCGAPVRLWRRSQRTKTTKSTAEAASIAKHQVAQ